MRVSKERLLRRAHTGDERGSLVVVMAIFFIVALVSVGLINRVQGDFSNTNYETNIEQARALAQSGVADAQFQIDQRDANPGTFCNAPAPYTCSLTSVPNAPGTVYVATYYPGGNPPSPYSCTTGTACYVIQSKGTYRNVSYAVAAVVSADPVLGSALAGSTLSFDGNTFANIDVTGANGQVIAGADADVAAASGTAQTPDKLTCNGPGSTSAIYIAYEYASVASNCGTVQNQPSTYQPQELSLTCPAPLNPDGEPPTPCLLGSAQSCSAMVESASSGSGYSGDNTNGWTIGVAGGSVLLQPGDYACYGGLTFQGTVNVDYDKTNNNGRVQIYAVGPSSSPSTSENLTLGGTINPCEVGSPTSNVSTNCVSGSQQIVGDPTDLQIYSYGSGTINLNSFNSANAVLWAPGMSLTCDGSSTSLTWTGAMILGTLKVNGSPNLTFNYDPRLGTEYQITGWELSSYLHTLSNVTIP